ncbi:Transcription factor [Pleurostoma richardsiae]|uniref:Transcription factor n=1 Tax=Pleurostoma richardsiae TaxID=41990 RepID=A0AA38RA64_9PEZI|nr:Transcription factor [Pleurostoma richardsiae]
MPPRASLTSSFSMTDANNEVVCPLRNQDGSSCRKRCIGEKRYRSMQEHIRRAHPEHYISKLPATEESFLLMINTPPSERPQPQQDSGVSNGPRTGGHLDHLKGYPPDRNAFFGDDSSAPVTPRNSDEYHGGSLLPAAAALAQLHNHKIDPDWDSEPDWLSDTEKGRVPRSSVGLPPLQFNATDVTSEPFPSLGLGRRRDILPSILSNSPPGRSSTLPPLQRPLGPNRPRKQSVTKRGREAHHKKQKSRGSASEWVKRGKIDIAGDLLRPGGHERPRPYSAEPSARSPWEDLIDAAASATEDIDEDRTPVPQSPISVYRASLPPFPQHNFPAHNYQASPLQQALTPPSYVHEAPDPFPSVESGDSGENFHMGSRGLSDSSPSYTSQNTQIYCAACQGISLLKDSYAWGRFKPFQLDIR